MINVLVVDDSAFMRQVFKRRINQESDMKTVDIARNGQQALELIEKHDPDVVTLDIEMPVKNGLETLKQIRETEKPLSVIMVSALDNKQTVIRALELGAFDFIPKPSGSISLDVEKIMDQLLTKIRAAARAENRTQKIKTLTAQYPKQVEYTGEKFPVIAIGSSSGGPRALKELISVFPAEFPGAFIIVQHMPAGFTSSLAHHLDLASCIKVREAAENDRIKPGTALLAPGDYHLEINQHGRVKLNQQQPEWGVRPCVDYMMIPVARVFRDRVIGVILTGMGHDGARGMKEIKEYNGYGIVEDKSTALVYGMPSSTIDKGAYDDILPLDQIGFKIIEIIERRS
ncbi:MAG: protein-glutamate methylesterase/protein-glutamine glutaminase [Bacillota bacterium]